MIGAVAASNHDIEFALEEMRANREISRRDPRLNPEPGDVLRVGAEEREVVDVRDNRVEYGFPNRAATRWLSLVAWQVWARHADVVKVTA